MPSKKKQVNKFAFSSYHRRKGYKLQGLVEEAVIKSRNGLTVDEIKTAIWDKHHISVTRTQINGAVAHLRVSGILEPVEKKRKTARQNVVPFRKAA